MTHTRKSPTAELEAAITRLRTITVAIQRVNGLSWREIGAHHGITRTGAWNRWHHAVAELIVDTHDVQGRINLDRTLERCIEDVDRHAWRHTLLRKDGKMLSDSDE